MVSEERIRLMTRAELIKKQQGKSNFLASHYYAFDYITMQAIKAVIGVTIVYVLVIAMWLIIHGEQLITDNKITVVFSLVRDFIILYAVAILLTILLSTLIYASKYWRARRKLDRYRDSLRQLERHYEEQDMTGRE